IYLLISLAIVKLISTSQKSKVIIFLGYLGFFGFYLNTYYAHYGRHWSSSWQYGYKQMVEYVESVDHNYERIYVTNTYGRPYTYLLLYLKYDPKTYISNRNAYGDAFGFTQTDSFDKYYFLEPTQVEKESFK